MILSSIAAVSLFVFVPPSSQVPTASSPAQQPASQGTRRDALRLHLPANLGIESIPLKTLVDMKPKAASKPQGLRYQAYFASHPSVRSINLHDKNIAKTTQDLVNLSNDDSYNHGTRNKITASIKRLIDNTPFESAEHYEELTTALKGVKYRASKKAGHTAYLNKIGKEARLEQTRLAKRKRKEMTGEGYNKSMKRRRKDAVLDKPLSYHLDKGGVVLSARQAELKARELARFYTTEGLLTRELHKYLIDKDIPPEERTIAMGIRQHHYASLADAERKTAARRSAADLQHASSGSQSPHLSSSSQPAVVNHASPQHHRGIFVDPNNELDWRLLHDFLHN